MMKQFKAIVVHRESKTIKNCSGMAKTWADFTHLCRMRLVIAAGLPLGEMISVGVINITGINGQKIEEEKL